MSDVKVRLEGVRKEYGPVQAVRGVDLEVRRGEFLTLLGPSGCGKTTTLMMIAGFERPTAGRIFIDGEDVTDLAPFERNVNTVFQNYALFPHMRVFDNVAFGLRVRRLPEKEIRERVHRALALVQLDGYAARWPRMLSGGQQQRVALARAIVLEPQVLLLDEPLGALDLKLRKEMQIELKRLQKHLGITFIYVTHDQEEALTMSDRIVVMHDGRIEQIGPPHEIYERPHTRFVAGFIGETNLLEAEVAPAGGLHLLGVRVPVPTESLAPGSRVEVSLRPERIRPANGESPYAVEVRVTDRIYVGASIRLLARGPGERLLVISGPAGSSLSDALPGQAIRVTWDPADCVVVTS
ncbi:ABC transporter ATP-binding protein [Caldinitratiruptor microaerophilus]|uniref:ABC transporter ATP-binding protein n=1 Tax=Caldinitratiruptor microaerophilus TaxID=671077 RepID=UPI00222F5242|nr:ABC transporter ATP-binding protein [Caldinitratiruptor microaerophilus]